MEMEVVKLVVKVLVAKGRGGERERGEKGSASSRNEGGLVFLSILDPISSSLRPWKSNLFISKGRGTLCLLWCQILALDSTRKHPSHWLKVVMKMVGRVGHFRAVSSPLKPRSIQTAYTDVQSGVRGLFACKFHPIQLSKETLNTLERWSLKQPR